MMQTRKNIRLPNYDYCQPGMYFVTICTAKKQKIFGSIRRGDPCGRPKTELSKIGEIANLVLNLMEKSYDCHIDCSIIMPNHIHILFDTTRRATARVAPTLGKIVGAYKSTVITLCRREELSNHSFWQRGYYEHIVRTERDLSEIRKYINENPDRWAEDKYYITD